MALKTRREAVAGSFYPASPVQLKEDITRLLSGIPQKTSDRKLRGLVVPHAGYMYSGEVAARAFAQVTHSSQVFQDVLLIGPSHHYRFEGIATDPHDYWQTPIGQVRIKSTDFRPDKNVHHPEHSLEVELPFIQTVLPDSEILPLLTGDDDATSELHKIMDHLGDETLLVISTDWSHFYPYDEATRLDQKSISLVEEGDISGFERQGIACGKTAVLIGMQIARERAWECMLIKYMNSGDVSRDRMSVVGYAAMAFWG